MARLRPLQLSRCPIQYREGLGEQPGTVKIEEIVEAGQDLVPVQRVRDLAFYVRDAPLCLQVLLAITVALLGASPILLQPLQLGGDLWKPDGLGLQATQLLLGGGEVGEIFLSLFAAVFGAALVRLGLAQVGREARVFAVCTL